MIRISAPVSVLVLAFLGLPLAALGSSPQLGMIMPRGVLRGGEHALTFSGARLTDVQEVFLYDAGVTVKLIEAIDDNNVKVTVDVAADCRLGEHIAQLRTTHGISEFRSFFVGALPAISEAEPNNDFAQPQRIDLNVTVDGVCSSEDVDYYLVTLTQGQRLSVEIEGIRLGTAFFDPFIAILDQDRFELAVCDDSPLLKQDAAISLLAPSDGDYTIAVRDSSYQGNDGCRYRLHVGHFPRPTVAYPAGGAAGQAVEVQFIGDAAGPISQTIQVPPRDQFRDGVFVQDEQGISPSPVLFRSVDFANVLETEPNQDFASASAASLPVAANGIISEAGDVDFFKFSARKAQVWHVACLARRVGSGLDPVINIFNAQQQNIAGNDDSGGPDSYLRWQVPEDGDYYVRVQDHLGRGEPGFVYRVEFHPVAPQLRAGIPRIDRYSQYRQSVFVPRGNRFATLVNASRADFGGELVLDDSQLPEGMRMVYQPMAANLDVMPVVFEADENAPLTGRLVDFKIRHKDNPEIEGHYYNLADFVLGPPNNARFVGCVTDKLPMAVIEKLPFRLELVQPQVPVVREGAMQLKVLAHRDEGFNTAINVQFPFRPPGIGAVGSVNIAEGQTEVEYTINANGNAEIGQWPMYVIGASDVGGAAWVSSQLATLEIAERLVTMDVKRSSCEQGQTAQVLCTLSQLTPFEGMAKAELLGLPPQASAEPIEFDKDAQEIVFQVATTGETPAGQHKSLFCQVTIMKNNQPIVALGGRSELQVDMPLPQTQAAPVQPAAAPPAEAEQKPLSRLEKLRQQVKQQKPQDSSGGENNGNQSGG